MDDQWLRKIKICPKCKLHCSDRWIDGKFQGYYTYTDPQNNKCIYCDTELQTLNITFKDAKVLSTVSDDINFFEAMIRLHDEDVIEYESRMAQFRVQAGQMDSIKKEREQEERKTKCPKCGCTEFTPLKKKWGLLAGFATNKVELVCNNCGYKMQTK